MKKNLFYKRTLVLSLFLLAMLPGRPARTFSVMETTKITRPTYYISLCGNGVPDPGEACDDGNTSDGDGCSSDCKTRFQSQSLANDTGSTGLKVRALGTIYYHYNAVCGNGLLEPGEGCEDGNTNSGDGCSATCQLEAGSSAGCGNGILESNEACEDHNTIDGDGCDSNCTPTGCGNGIVTAGEECDDGNLVGGDGCNPNCKKTGP